ncbi:MAG: hypothetical protein HQL58_12540 [Magnetococcales bacterium]|nr:hypothetical protein [Magnetococcales bacterium]
MEKNTAQHGFDSTDIHNATWEELTVGMSYSKSRTAYGTELHAWKNEKLAIYTTNNPITGECNGRQGARMPPRIGFAGYIGIEGDAVEVAEAVQYIRETAIYIKDESIGIRAFC